MAVLGLSIVVTTSQMDLMCRLRVGEDGRVHPRFFQKWQLRTREVA